MRPPVRLVWLYLVADMIILLLVFGVATAQRGHYIVDYQRLPLYQEFYLSPGVYRPLFPTKQESSGSHEARQVDIRSEQHAQQAPPKHLHHKFPHHQQVVHYQDQEQQQQHDQQQQQQHDQQQPVTQPLVLEQPLALQDQPVVVAQVQPAVVAQVPQVFPAPVAHEQPSVAQVQPAAVVQDQSAVVVAAEQPSAPVLKYSNSMTPDGSYSYKYETADGMTREETSVMEAAEDGRMVASVKGSYSYPGPDGRTITVNYIADEGGFRASGDHLPQTLQDTVYNFKYIVP